MDQYMQCLTATNAKWSNGGVVAFFNSKSPLVGQWIRRPPSGSRSTIAHACPPPLGALRGSGGLLEFFWDADHQTLEEAFDEPVRRVTPIYRNTIRKKEAALCLLAWWSATRKLAEMSKSATS